MSDDVPTDREGQAVNCARGCTKPGTDDEPEPAITGRLCTSCATTIRQALRAIPDLTAHAFDNGDGRLTPGRAGDDTGRHAINGAPPSPSPAYDLADEVRQWVWRTAETGADANRQRGPFRYRRDGVPAVEHVAELVGYVIDNLSWYAYVIPLETYDEATGWRRRLEKMTGQDRLIHRIKQPCSRCNRRTLTREDGSNWVTCRNSDCKARWHTDDAWTVHVTAAS